MDIDQELIKKTLQEIDSLLKQGVMPVNNAHLKHLSSEDGMLSYLIRLKDEGLISGDLTTDGADRVKPHRMTNIRLTYIGIKKLRQMIEQSAG
ncbi:MAG TPA: hypothetical protein VFM05_09355 [Candidatus Saccharimonadales bacterium]|nr:hypothetical protein [Candidatus Saccharimonadales bacterium]